jgi:uncharacterized protein YdiU (UPF0061 family)
MSWPYHSSLSFDNRWLRQLPLDPNPENYPRQVTGAVNSPVVPRRASEPRLLAFSAEVADLLGIAHEDCLHPDFAQVFVGNQLLPGMEPHASCYGGHQFGHWAGQLGDGRAINLGEVVNAKGQHWTLQLKGAGPTPYSRTADGLAVLRSSVREFLCSEAMHHLGVPSTRALSLITTGDQVRRDMFYNGNPQWEPGAVVCRVAPSFTRFGHFEIFSARGEHQLLRQLLDLTMATDFVHLGEPSVESYCRWFEEVCRRTAELMVHWMRVGFVHGVMNTDNMSVLGLTIDYGPYGWLEPFDPDWTPNTTDAQGRRYRFGHQPQVALWNLVQLANAIYPLINQVEPLQQALDVYRDTYDRCWQKAMADKLGLGEFLPADQTLVDQLLALMQTTAADMTIFHRNLASVDLQLASDTFAFAPDILLAPLQDAFYSPLTQEQTGAWCDWLASYRLRLIQDSILTGTTHEVRRLRMNGANPKYVLRNYLAQQAIDKASEGDFSEINRLLELVKKPYDEQPEHQHYFARRPDWAANKPGCAMLSCSS